MTSSSSSGARRPKRRPSRSVESVRIWLILTQERLGSFVDWISSVSGKPALGWRLVMATAITVPDRSLNTSSLRTATGRRPACSWPRTGLSSAQTTSPLSIRAMRSRWRETPRRLSALLRDRAWHTLAPSEHGASSPASRQEHPESAGYGLGRHRPAPVCQPLSGHRGRGIRQSWRRACRDGSTEGHTGQVGAANPLVPRGSAAGSTRRELTARVPSSGKEKTSVQVAPPSRLR